MAEHLFNRAFSTLNAQVAKAQDEMNPDARKRKIEKTDEQRMREKAAPMSASDAVQRILLAWKDQDYFRRALSAGSVAALGSCAYL